MPETYIVTAVCKNCGRENKHLKILQGTSLSDVECRACKCTGSLQRKPVKRPHSGYFKEEGTVELE